MNKSQKSDTDATETEYPFVGSSVSTKKHIRGSTLLLAGRLIGVLVNFVIQIIIIRYLAKAEYGAFAFASAVMMIGSNFVALGLNKGLNRFVPIYQERGQYDMMAGTIVLVLCTMVVFGSAMAALIFGLGGVIGGSLAPDPLSLSLLLIFVWVAPLQALDEATVKLFAIFTSPRSVFFRRHILTPGLRFAAVLALIFFEGDAVFLAVAYLVIGVLGVIIALAIIVQVLRRKGLLRFFHPKNLNMPVRKIFIFSLPLLSSDLVAALRGTLVIVFLGFFQGAVAVAAFRSVLFVARLNGMVFDSFRLLFEPTAGRLYARNDWAGINAFYWQTASWVVVFTFPIFAISFALAQPLTVLLFGERYADSGMVLSILAVGIFLNAAFGYNADMLRVLNRVRVIVAIDLTVALLALLLFVLLIPQFGALGGAIASCAVIVTQNFFYQMVLVRTGAVKLIDLRFLKVLFIVIGAAAGLFIVQQIFAPPIHVGFMLAAVTSLLVLSLAGPTLRVETAFPEFTRIAAMRWLLRIPGNLAVASQKQETLSPQSTLEKRIKTQPLWNKVHRTLSENRNHNEGNPL
ncbi:MAG: oligosaccharide flippase family protein [Methylococcales bacterium]